MRLNINAGGLDGFFNGVCSFLSGEVSEANSNHLINSLSNIVNKTNNLNGGVGALSIGLDYVQTRKAAEESRKIAIDNVKSKTDGFIQMALRVDAEVAAMVTSSQEAFYQTNPWLRPPTPPSTWDKIWDTAGDTFSKCWNGVVEFCCSNIGKIIFGVLAVVGAIALVTLIISTGGLLLVPLLSAWGLSAALATGISLTVGGIALASTAVAFIPNCLDLAAALDEVIDPENNAISDFNKELHQQGWYNTTQSVANITSAISGGFYSIGMVYNAFKAARIKGGSEIVDDVIEGGLDEIIPLENGPYIKDGKPNGRPSLSGEAKLEFEQNVYSNCVDADGILRDPNTGDIINWTPGNPRKNVVDFGHNSGSSYNEMFLKYKNKEIILDELKEFQFDPLNYRLETPSTNRSHLFE